MEAVGMTNLPLILVGGLIMILVTSMWGPVNILTDFQSTNLITATLRSPLR